ncbi:MAG: hypothetical protein MJ252_28955, partial [archaeon]|nr:hypothetical protein [archaeon]
MSNSIIEMIRSKHEEIEQLEKALSKAIAFKENNPKEKVTAEIIIKKCVDLTQKRSKEILSLYEDKDKSFKKEAQVFLGKKLEREDITNKRQADVWYNFYEKIKEIKRQNYNELNPLETNENIPGDKIFSLMLEEENGRQLFTNEENKGTCIDLHFLYQNYINVKGIYEYNDSKIIDYLTYISTFHNLSNIPLKIKMSKDYLEYLQSLNKYLKDYFRKVNPLIDFDEIQDIID